MKKATIEKKVDEKKKFARGIVTATRFVIDSPEAIELDAFLQSAVDIPKRVFDRAFNRMKEICQYTEEARENQIVMIGRSVFAGILNAETTYTGAINWGALGTSSTAISDAQTKLNAEVKRKGVATRSRTNDSVSLRFFFSKADVSGTFQEFGTFIDGTSTVDTGQIFNALLTGGWTKSSSESLTVTVQFDLNPA